MNPNGYVNVIEGIYKDDTDLMARFSQYKRSISENFPTIDWHFVLVVDNEMKFYFATYKVSK